MSQLSQFRNSNPCGPHIQYNAREAAAVEVGDITGDFDTFAHVPSVR